jgi:predicted TIM-barrel fold metal-dependent hydrolase
MGEHWQITSSSLKAMIAPDRWLSDFAKLEIRDEIRPKVSKANARKLLGIQD